MQACCDSFREERNMGQKAQQSYIKPCNIISLHANLLRFIQVKQNVHAESDMNK